MLCLFLAALFLVSGAVVTVSADTQAKNNTTDKSIMDYQEDKMDYEEYMKQYADYFKGTVGAATQTYTFDATANWTFRDSNKENANVITMSGDSWTLTKADGTVYNSVEDAVQNGNFKKENLVYVTTEYDGKPAIYTPSTGSVSWILDLSQYGITDATLFSIELEYYPVDGKASFIEREFYLLNEGEEQPPFSEARSLTLAKLWSYAGGDNDDMSLTATYVLAAGDNYEAIRKEALDAGFTVMSDGSDQTKIIVEKPALSTVKTNAFEDKYSLRYFVRDAEGNEIRPTIAQKPEWTSYTFYDGDGFYSDSFGFVLKPDENGKLQMTLKSVNEPAAISKIILKPYTTSISYDAYRQDLIAQVGETEGKDVIKLEAEYNNSASTNVVYPLEDRTSPMTSPADTKHTILNTIGTEKWQTASQWVQYNFKVENSGWYDIYSRFRQSYLDGMFVSRSLQIYTNYASAQDYLSAKGNTAGYYNGIPFSEAGKLRYTYGNNWQVTSMNSGADADDDGAIDTYQVYFEAGVEYSLRLEVTLGDMSEQIRDIQNVLDRLNADYLAIIKLTGANPDDYRDYGFSRLLYDNLLSMMQQSIELKNISEFLKENGGVASSYTGTCDKLSNLLDKMSIDEDSIAKNLDTFKTYIGSLGTFLTDAKTQPLQLDYITIQPASVKAPKASGNFFQNFWHEFQSFMQSFFRDYNSMGAMETEKNEKSESVTVWLAYGRDQSQVIRNLSTNEFTNKNGIAVDLKLVTGSTLLPSILAGMGPDVYLGLAQATLINYAIRGALQNIETMEGFDEVVDDFTDAAMLVLGTYDSDGDMHYYGLPENQDFPMMFVRVDILKSLNVEIPKTWEELYIAQSKLQSNNMAIGVPVNYKVHLYQSGGELFADNGMRINLDSTEGLTAFNTMCNMFTQYSFPYKYDAANRFRTGEMPIIISDYTNLYNKLKVFATELDGSWTFVPLPGYYELDENGDKIVDDNGDYVINNESVSTVLATVMISGTTEEQQKVSWEFMKWYTGKECQTRYANEMVAIIGDSAKHPTAHREALEQMPWTPDELAEVRKQFDNLAAVPNYPGYYYIDRYTEFAFLSAYNDDADPSTELLSYINTINNEITRKREEFKLETLEIGQTLADKRLAQATKAMTVLAEKNNEAYNDVIDAAKYAIANRKITQLDEVSELFAGLLDPNAEQIEIVKASGQKVMVPSYYKNVGKQTSESKNGGYRIDALNEQQLIYFISQCLADAADAIASY